MEPEGYHLTRPTFQVARQEYTSCFERRGRLDVYRYSGPGNVRQEAPFGGTSSEQALLLQRLIWKRTEVDLH